MKKFIMKNAQAQWEYTFNCSISEAWKHLSDTNQMNQILGFPDVKYLIKPESQSNNRQVFAEIKLFKFLKFRWEEEPFEWEYEKSVKIKRIFKTQPISEVTIQIDFLSGVESQTIVKVSTHIVLNNRLFCPIFTVFLSRCKKKWLRYCSGIEASIASPRLEMSMLKFDFLKIDSLLWIENRLLQLNPEVANKIDYNKLISFFTEQSAKSIEVIRPHQLSQFLNISQKLALSVCLELTLLGIYQLEFKTVCPHCHGNSSRSATLSQLEVSSRCETCQLDFQIHFEDAIEAVFSLSPRIHKAIDVTFCLGSPSRTRHIDSQFKLASKESKTVDVKCPCSYFELRSLQIAHLIKVIIIEASELLADSSPNVIHIDMNTVEAKIKRHNRSQNIVVCFTNDSNSEIVLSICSAIDPVVRCTISDLASHSMFRKYFKSQLLRNDHSLALKNTTLLFTDISGSTAMYEKIGDAEAFLKVQSQFEIVNQAIDDHQGALVKTIGDAVMGVFNCPLDGLKAALQMQRMISEKSDLKLKVGIHHGPVFAVNLNERLDYFGRTVNLAARTEGQCQAGEIVITSQIFNDFDVINWLEGQISLGKIETTHFKADLKGISNAQDLIRVSCTSSLNSLIQTA